MPARADIPSFAPYFSGTWSCTSRGGAHVVKAFGASANGEAFVLWNTYTTALGYVGDFYETYAKQGANARVMAQLDSGPGFVGTSPGFQNGKLVFSGTRTGVAGAPFVRMTYTRLDRNHFTRGFQSGPSAQGPLSEDSMETCVRVSSAPIPTPKATLP